MPRRPELPVARGPLPKLYFLDTPCEADGRPWDGRPDPAWRITLLVLTALNRAVSVRWSRPRRAHPVPPAGPPA